MFLTTGLISTENLAWLRSSDQGNKKNNSKNTELDSDKSRFMTAFNNGTLQALEIFFVGPAGISAKMLPVRYEDVALRVIKTWPSRDENVSVR
jgi:hypothetical protein